MGGKGGFLLELTSRDRRELAYRMITYGVLTERWFYKLRYDAPERYYFGRDLATFERMVASFSLD